MSTPESPAAAAVLTAKTRGAIAVIRVWGPRALVLADQVFRPFRPLPLAKTQPGELRYGRIGAGLGDEVVAAVTSDFPAEVEIHCHGGPAAVDLVMAALCEAGADPLDWSNWLNSRPIARTRNEAMEDLRLASTLSTAEILLVQSEGALDREVLAIMAMISVDPRQATGHLQTLVRRSEVGLRLLRGWKVALVGPPNAGKSRLLNALAGFDRSIVSPEPGTTRDLVTITTAIDGFPAEIADMAGLRETDHPIELEGIERARIRAFGSDIRILVLDRAVPLDSDAQTLVETIKPDVVVANKIDLAGMWEPWNDAIISISAERGDGLERLLAEIRRRMVKEIPPRGSGVPFRESHRQILLEALDLLDRKEAVAAELVLRRLVTQALK